MTTSFCAFDDVAKIVAQYLKPGLQLEIENMRHDGLGKTIGVVSVTQEPHIHADSLIQMDEYGYALWIESELSLDAIHKLSRMAEEQCSHQLRRLRPLSLGEKNSFACE